VKRVYPKLFSIAALNMLIALLCSAPLHAQQAVSQKDGAIAQLQGLLEQTQSLSAEAEQLIMDQDGRELQEARALLLMEKPARFRWAITQPYEQLSVTDGETMWLYEPDLGQVTIQTFEDDLDRTPVMLLNGDAADIADTYDVSSTDMGNDFTRFILMPRNTDRLFERMSLTFKGPVLEEMQFEDSLGQQTSLTFLNIERNISIDASQFSFTPPAGIDVIDTRE
jgi:outer membrane lipoprotein carrier protein